VAGLAFIVLELISQNATLEQNIRKIQENYVLKDEEIKDLLEQLNSTKEKLNSCEENFKAISQRLNLSKNEEDNLKNKLEVSALQLDTATKEKTELFNHILKPGIVNNNYISFLYFTFLSIYITRCLCVCIET